MGTATADTRPQAPRRVIVWSTAAVSLLVATAVWSAIRFEPSHLLRLDLAAAVAACALVPVAIRRPFAGGLALSVLTVLSHVVTPAATFAALNTARQRPTRQALLVGAAGVTGHAVLGWWRPAAGLSYRWWLLLVVVTYAALLGWGTWARAREALLNSLRERAHRAEAEQQRRVAEARLAERTRMAREMHDVLAHRLSLLAVYAGALEYRPDAPPQRLAEAAGVIRDGVHQALDELREVVTVLRQDPDEDPDGPPGPGLDDVPRLVRESNAAGLTVGLDDRIGLPAEVSAVTGRTAYRIVQEALTNARKHAAGRPVRIVLAGRPGGRLTVDVRNRLAPAGPGLPGAGLGLLGLAERVTLAGGELRHSTESGEFQLYAELPWRT
ncbi:sensor histidine kinase [Actinoplanes aureus]|uniref:histidine kinase n=1 Tax=Actinoplanes aureus TaxID=2792083 RepID=A0A931G2A2_9ACTN|nr:histidine kinase [Actinoplanes aureus]MBG0565951.1 sensor histidine kinase [Actinoplanes aureus]